MNNLIGKLRCIIFKFVKLKHMQPLKSLRNTYYAFYQSIFQYGLLA